MKLAALLASVALFAFLPVAVNAQCCSASPEHLVTTIPTLNCSTSQTTDSLRIERPIYATIEPQFASAFGAGFSTRWLRNFRQPSFCPYILCNGTCATGLGIMGPGDLELTDCGTTVISEKTPCSLSP